MGAIKARIIGIELEFETSPSVFSPSAVDAGTQAMLREVTFEPADRVLDLGCGYGVVGIVAARLIGAGRVVMVDVEPGAVQLARRNARANGVPGAKVELGDGLSATREAGFTKILCNPPYHVDFSVPKRFIEKGFNRLAIGGRMYMVVQRRTWYEKKLRGIFGGVSVNAVGPYFVMTAEKRRRDYARG